MHACPGSVATQTWPSAQQQRHTACCCAALNAWTPTQFMRSMRACSSGNPCAVKACTPGAPRLTRSSRQALPGTICCPQRLFVRIMHRRYHDKHGRTHAKASKAHPQSEGTSAALATRVAEVRRHRTDAAVPGRGGIPTASESGLSRVFRERLHSCTVAMPARHMRRGSGSATGTHDKSRGTAQRTRRACSHSSRRAHGTAVDHRRHPAGVLRAYSCGGGGSPAAAPDTAAPTPPHGSLAGGGPPRRGLPAARSTAALMVCMHGKLTVSDASIFRISRVLAWPGVHAMAFRSLPGRGHSQNSPPARSQSRYRSTGPSTAAVADICQLQGSAGVAPTPSSAP